VTGTLTFPRVEGIVLEGADLAVESAVEELVALMPDIGDQSHHLQAGLLTDAREYATCLVPGAVLLHAHTPLVAQVSLLVGIAPAGVRFPKQDDAIDLIFVLLSPSAQAPQEHLRRLAAIAHLVRRADSLTALRAARDAKAIRTVVTEATD
jgi:mannitol/fructose-specific phosphotransferase system IIA component (Ntr-type)